MENIKLIIKFILVHALFIGAIYLGYLYPETEITFAVKAVSYIMIPLSIFGNFYYIVNPLEMSTALTLKLSNNIYNTVDLIFDIIMLLVFSYLGWKIIIVLWIISALSNYLLKAKLKEELKKLTEDENDRNNNMSNL